MLLILMTMMLSMMLVVRGISGVGQCGKAIAVGGDRSGLDHKGLTLTMLLQGICKGLQCGQGESTICGYLHLAVVKFQILMVLWIKVGTGKSQCTPTPTLSPCRGNGGKSHLAILLLLLLLLLLLHLQTEPLLVGQGRIEIGLLLLQLNSWGVGDVTCAICARIRGIVRYGSSLSVELHGTNIASTVTAGVREI